MSFNFYGLPGFISYSILLGISLVLIRQKQETRLRYWMGGWLLILLHSSIFMLLPSRFPFDLLARGTLALAGQVFILAAYYQGPATISRSRLISRVSLSSALNIVFAVASTAYAERGIAGQDAGPFYLLIALGAASTLWLAAGDSAESRWHRQINGIDGAGVCASGVVPSCLWPHHGQSVADVLDLSGSGVFLSAANLEAGHGRRVHCVELHHVGVGLPGIFAVDDLFARDLESHRI